MALSTQPYKGARDFFPEDKRLQTYIFNKIRRTVESFGYEEYDAPILESIELYRAKSGEEIVNEQTYNFVDRGGREVVIRPEMTPTVSRMVAARRQEHAYPLRWYSIPNLWRYERPQRGRLREHWQLNVDIFGVMGHEAELEVIKVTDQIYKNFGATAEMYLIKVNDRRLTDFILQDYLDLTATQAYATAKLIDKMHKITHEVFMSAVDEILDSQQKESGALERLLTVLDCHNLSSLPEPVRAHSSTGELAALIKRLQSSGVSNVSFDATLMRGFDYYTGIVFEVNDTHPDNNRSMMGGGRYDGLVGMFGVEPVPTVGFGLGDATLANFLELHALTPVLNTETHLYIVPVVAEVIGACSDIASRLRMRGVNVAVDLSGRKLGDQLKTADKKGIRFCLVVGPDEIAAAAYSLKDLTTGESKTVQEGQIPQFISIPEK